MMRKSGEKPFMLMETSVFFHILKIRDRIMAKICPITVAMAAPRIPMAGQPKSPKIMIGSRIMLVTAPIPWENIL